MMISVHSEHIASVRAFNRFYTNVIGLLHSGHLDTPYSLTEARVLFELAQNDSADLRELRQNLNIDAGYLSRILARFTKNGLVDREISPDDGRRQVVSLTGEGRAAFTQLDERSADEIGALLSGLEPDRRRQLVEAMRTVQDLLGDKPDRSSAYLLREPEAGEYGWVIERHGALYSSEYGWDSSFEALVTRVVADYLEQRDPARERAWIADVDGVPAGCVFCVKGDPTDDNSIDAPDADTAKLRLLLVEPWARGLGIGGRLVSECTRFAESVGYRTMTLWTNDVLTEARRIYERAGFVLVREEKHRSFGHDLVGQYWSKQLKG